MWNAGPHWCDPGTGGKFDKCRWSVSDNEEGGMLIRTQAQQWLEDIRTYIHLNPSVKGFPANDKQVFEI